MPDNFQAGSISLELKAQIDQLNAGFDKAKAALRDFSGVVGQTAAQVQTSSQAISAGFDQVDRSSIRVIDRFVRLTAGMAATQIALESLRGQNGLSGVQVALEAAARGLQAFIVIFNSLPGVGGAVLGSIAAIIAGYNQLTKAIDEVEKKQEDLNKRLAKRADLVITTASKEEARLDVQPEQQGALNRTITEYVGQLERAKKATTELKIAEAELSQQGPGLQKTVEELNRQYASLAEQIAKAGKPNFELDGRLAGLAEESDKATQKLEKLRESVAAAARALGNTNIQEVTQRIRDLKEALSFTKTEEQARRLVSVMNDVEVEGERAVELGLDTPLQAAQRNLQATEAALRKIIAAEEDLKKAMGLVGDDDELRAVLQRQLEILQENEKSIGGRARNQRQLTDAQINAGNLASGLSRSIGDAVAQGILNGEKAMQVLADVGRNLFSNMLQKSVDQFEKGMVSAFQSIAGQGGEALGAALTGILGVVGGILSRRRDGSQSFASIQSGIASTQAVRGIVAGPTNVAIAAVGEDLQRSMQPVVERLDSVVRILGSIDSKTGRGGGFGFSVPAVSIPTA